jgi:transposase
MKPFEGNLDSVKEKVLVDWKLSRSPAKRRKYVELRVAIGKSNRAIAKELDVDEGTIRRDRKFLAIPEHEWPVKAPRPKKPKKVRPAKVLEPAEVSRRRFENMLDVVKHWINEQGFVLTEIEYVLEEAGKRLYQGRNIVRGLPDSPHSPAELLSMTRPNHEVEDYMPVRLEYCVDWLARWIACCLPGDEARQDQFRREVSLWARS